MGKTIGIATLAAGALIVALVSTADFQSANRTASESHSENLRGPEVRGTHLSASLGAAMHEARYAVWRADGNAPAGEVTAGEVLHADNPAQQYRTEFEADAVRVSSTSRGEAGSWTLALRLESYGNARQVTPPAAQRVAVGRRVEYRRGNVVEWYENTDEGLEQGFTIERPPVGMERENMLEVRVAVDSNLTPRANAAGSRVDFYSSPGVRVATYGKLKVTDANGKELPAKMGLISISTSSLHLDNSLDGSVEQYARPTRSDNSVEQYARPTPTRFSTSSLHLDHPLPDALSIVISVDTTDAHYPITIDPLISNETKITADDGATGDQFGRSVAIDGDTAVVGAYLANVAGNYGQGAAYVFVRSGIIWTQQAKLTAADGAASDYFGSSVSVSGDTAVVGAQDADVGSIVKQGAAYVFVRSGTSWNEQAKIIAADGGAFDLFGDAVSVSGDTAIVGAAWANVGANGNQGAAYFFYPLSGVPADTIPPTVVSTNPFDGATAVPLVSSIQVSFSEPMDTVATEGAFSIGPATAGSISWNAPGDTLTFTPSADLTDSTIYTVTIGTGAADIAGNTLGATYSFSFNTSAGSNSRHRFCPGLARIQTPRSPGARL